jgi:RNA polymerase sigma-70 factor, ECF subfamily
MGEDRAFLFGRWTHEQLLTFTPTAVVARNRAVAVAEVRDRREGLESIDALSLDGYYLYHAIRADLLRRLDWPDDATAAYCAAIDRTDNATEIRFLSSRIAAIRDGLPCAGDGPPSYA